MKTKFFSLVVALLITTALKADFKVGNLWYNWYHADPSTVPWEVFVSDSYDDYKGLTSVSIPDTIYYEGEVYVVRGISTNAFRNCDSLVSVTIGKYVYYIGGGVFMGCSALKSINFPDDLQSIGDTAFCDCTNLKLSINLPNRLRKIGDRAFDNCPYITSITVPNSVTSIGKTAFYGIDYVVYNGTATGSPWGAKSVNGYREGFLIYEDSSKKTLVACLNDAVGSIEIPNSVTNIKGCAFDYCDDLTSVTLPSGLKKIGDYVFFDCHGLSSLVIPNSVTHIGMQAFAYCTNLPSIVIPNSVKSMDAWAFESCTNLVSVTLLDSLTEISEGMFKDCSSLSSIAIPNSVTTIGISAFENCAGLKRVILPDNLSIMIGLDAFSGCSNLSEIDIPNGVKNLTIIGSFRECSNLSSIDIPNGVKNLAIRVDAFRECFNLTSFSIPKSVESLDLMSYGSPFVGCQSLSSLYVEEGNTIYDSREDCNAIIETATNSLLLACNSTFIPDNISSIGDYAFVSCTNMAELKIPKGVISIGRNCFTYCENLKSITVLADVPPAAGAEAFNYGRVDADGITHWHGVKRDIPVYIPRGTKAAYQAAAEWYNFTNYIEIETAIENTNADKVPTQNKICRNGEVLIKSGDKMYTPAGLEVK